MNSRVVIWPDDLRAQGLKAALRYINGDRERYATPLEPDETHAIGGWLGYAAVLAAYLVIVALGAWLARVVLS